MAVCLGCDARSTPRVTIRRGLGSDPERYSSWLLEHVRRPCQRRPKPRRQDLGEADCEDDGGSTKTGVVHPGDTPEDMALPLRDLPR